MQQTTYDRSYTSRASEQSGTLYTRKQKHARYIDNAVVSGLSAECCAPARASIPRQRQEAISPQVAPSHQPNHFRLSSSAQTYEDFVLKAL